MPVITISRQYASGGSEIARLVAQRLGWELVDNEFVDRVARLAGLPREEVEQHEERVTGFMERLARTLTSSSPELFMTPAAGPPVTVEPPEEEIVRLTERVIAEAVRHDRVILVGRGAPAYLAQREGTLHVMVVAPLEVRVRRAMERLKADQRDAERTIHEIDEGRRQYVKTHYRRRWDDPANYHLILNTDVFSYEQCAELIEAAVRLRGWEGR
jgi:cytidylate kinase